MNKSFKAHMGIYVSYRRKKSYRSVETRYVTEYKKGGEENENDKMTMMYVQ